MISRIHKILNAPAPPWLIRWNRRRMSKRVHKCADQMLMLGGDREYKIAVELRTIAHRLSDLAESKAK